MGVRKIRTNNEVAHRLGSAAAADGTDHSRLRSRHDQRAYKAFHLGRAEGVPSHYGKAEWFMVSG